MRDSGNKGPDRTRLMGILAFIIGCLIYMVLNWLIIPNY